MALDLIFVQIELPAGETKIVEFERQAIAHGLRVGSDPTCELPLSGTGVPALHGRLQPISNHWVWFQAEGGVLPSEYTKRVDYGPIKIAGYTIQVLPPTEEQE